MASKVRVAWQDVLFAKGAIWVVCGPIAPLAPELVTRTLNNMASHGPGTRVGLIPRAVTRRWEFDERPGDTGVDADFTFDSNDVNEMMAQMMIFGANPNPNQIVSRGIIAMIGMAFDTMI